MQIPDSVQVGDKVLIIRPFYVTGKVGVVCGRESHSDGQSSTRWLIQVEVEDDEENIVVSLTRNEFEVISLESE